MTSYGVKTDRISSQRTALPLLMGTDAEASNYNLLIMDAPTWKERPVKILDALKGMNARPTHVKTILLLKNEEDSTGIDLATSEVDYVLPQPLIPSILFNALLELFPMRNASPTQSTEPLSPTKPDKSYRVLVVEDNPTNQIIALEVLTQAGFQVVIASNGRKGVDRFLQSIQHVDAGDGIERFDVILMDLHMDVMDGYEATRLIREQDSHIPIIATTADILDSVRDRCAVSGVTTVVCKPYNPDELIAKIVEVIERGIQQVLDGAGSGGASAIGAIDFDDAIKRLGGDRALYTKVVDSFLVEHTRLSCQLNDQVAKGSYWEAVNPAHTLKGGCGTIGAYAAQKIAAGLQMELENGPSDRLSDLMKRFNHEFTLVISDAKRWRAREKQTS